MAAFNAGLKERSQPCHVLFVYGLCGGCRIPMEQSDRAQECKDVSCRFMIHGQGCSISTTAPAVKLLWEAVDPSAKVTSTV